MIWAKTIMAFVFGACFGFVIAISMAEGEYAMAALALGILVGIFYLVVWMIDTA